MPRLVEQRLTQVHLNLIAFRMMHFTNINKDETSKSQTCLVFDQRVQAHKQDSS